MCGCKDCKGITLLKGTDGVGIVSITDNGDGTFTILLTNGSTFISPDYTGPEGQSIDHVSFTSSTGIPSSTPNQPGETDTYTVWGDAGETINLGTFTVYNGANEISPLDILYSVHPKDSTTTYAIETLGDPLGYKLVEWGAVATGTILEMEFDLHSDGPQPEIAGSGYITFYLNESNVYLPDLNMLGNPTIPIVDDEYRSINVKITITKNTDTEGYISMIAIGDIAGGTSGPTGTIVWKMSKFITLATAPGVAERIEVLALAYSSPITLDRVIIKAIHV